MKQLKTNKLKLIAELNELNDQTTKTTELKVNQIVQAAEMNKQILQQPCTIHEDVSRFSTSLSFENCFHKTNMKSPLVLTTNNKYMTYLFFRTTELER